MILGREEAQERLYPELSAIAPTIVTDAGGAGWQLNLRLHGEALGRTNDAERLLIDWDRRVAALRDVVGAAQVVVSAVLVTRNGLFVSERTRSPAGCWRTWGWRVPRQRGPFERKAVRPDAMASHAADLILLSVAPGRSRSPPPRGERRVAQADRRALRQAGSESIRPSGGPAAGSSPHAPLFASSRALCSGSGGAPAALSGGRRGACRASCLKGVEFDPVLADQQGRNGSSGPRRPLAAAPRIVLAASPMPPPRCSICFTGLPPMVSWSSPRSTGTPASAAWSMPAAARCRGAP